MKLNDLSILFIFAIAIPFEAYAGLWNCNPATIKPGKTTSGCIKVDNLKREYYLNIPNNYYQIKHNIPLVIGLHGGGGKPKRFENYALLNNVVDNNISVYPKGINKHWNDGRASINSSIDDVQFLNQLVSHLDKDLSLDIDTNKIVVIGMSNGGLMALRMACEQPKWLSGIGVVAATMSNEIKAYCHSKTKLRPIKIAFVFGDKDTSFLPNGQQVNPIKPSKQRGAHIGINNTIKFWQNNNHCKTTADKLSLNLDTNDETVIIKSTFQQCLQSVVYFDVKNGGHRWPNLDSKNNNFLVKRLNVGIASQDMDTTKELLSVLF